MRQNRFKSVAGLVGSLGTKQNDKSGIDTVLKDFPLFCPKCKLTH
ncbi:MAG: cysteine-rich KTR domain-containing protein, partial [Ruminococcus sp.]